MLKNLYYWLLPPTCILCHARSEHLADLCKACTNDLPILPQSCPRCRKTLPASTPSDLLCGDCLQQLPAFDATYALFAYQTPITKLIMELKFHQQLINAKILGQLMIDALQNRWYQNQARPDVLIPIPLHQRRLQERGFNQALEIARPISKALQIPINTTCCQRVKYTQAQAQLQADHRNQNMKNSFVINQNLAGRHVAVIDDVITTGRTVSEFATVLKKAGAERVDIWAIARATLL